MRKLKQLQALHPDTRIPAYADDFAGIGSLDNIGFFFHDLELEGPDIGYYPQPAKSILVVPEKCLARAKAWVAGQKASFTVVTGHRYLGGWIGNPVSRDTFIANKAENWVQPVERLTLFAERHPQAASTLFSRCLRGEWTYLQRICTGIGHHFEGLERTICKRLLPALLGEGAPPSTRSLRQRTFFPAGQTWRTGSL